MQPAVNRQRFAAQNVPIKHRRRKINVLPVAAECALRLISPMTTESLTTTATRQGTSSINIDERRECTCVCNLCRLCRRLRRRIGQSPMTSVADQSQTASMMSQSASWTAVAAAASKDQHYSRQDAASRYNTAETVGFILISFHLRPSIADKASHCLCDSSFL